MRSRWMTGGALAVLLAAGAASLLSGGVTAQESALPPVVTPEEAAPAPAPAPEAPPSYATDEAGLPTAPVPYNVLVPPRQRQQRRAENSTTTAPTAETPIAPGELPPQAPRVKRQAAILQAVDKVTAETLMFEAEVGKPVRYKTLVFTLRACETEAVDEPVRESAAHLSITSQPKAQPGRVQPEAAQVFRGWMFASSAGLNPFEHPIYDAWLISCKVPPEPVVIDPSAPLSPATPAGRPAAAPPQSVARSPAPVTSPG